VIIVRLSGIGGLLFASQSGLPQIPRRELLAGSLLSLCRLALHYAVPPILDSRRPLWSRTNIPGRCLRPVGLSEVKAGILAIKARSDGEIRFGP
jgi:hypothetical protein